MFQQGIDDEIMPKNNPQTQKTKLKEKFSDKLILSFDIKK